MSECAWFKCRKPFSPPHHRSRFCTKKCQATEKNWRMMRGAPIVKALLEQPAGPADIRRMVAVLEAEQRDYTP